MKKSKLMTKKVLIPAVLVVVLLLGLSYAANQKIVADRLAAEAYEEEYGERTSRDGQFLISFNPTQEGKKEAILEDFPGKYYGLTAAGAWHEYEGAPLVEIASEAFGKIADLEKVILPQTVKTIGSSAFAECPALKEVYLPASVVNISEDAFAECHNLDTVVLPETLESVGKSAFRDCEKLRKVCFLENVFSIADDAFEGASQVTICAPKNSYAHYYAAEHDMNFEEWYGG